LGKATVMYVR